MQLRSVLSSLVPLEIDRDGVHRPRQMTARRRVQASFGLDIRRPSSSPSCGRAVETYGFVDAGCSLGPVHSGMASDAPIQASGLVDSVQCDPQGHRRDHGPCVELMPFGEMRDEDEDQRSKMLCVVRCASCAGCCVVRSACQRGASAHTLSVLAVSSSVLAQIPDLCRLSLGYLAQAACGASQDPARPPIVKGHPRRFSDRRSNCTSNKERRPLRASAP